MALVLATFFFASAGASSAYLTVSEIFPMETRALAIALFYAVGTAVGGISGPLLFGHFIHSGVADQVAHRLPDRRRGRWPSAAWRSCCGACGPSSGRSRRLRRR